MWRPEFPPGRGARFLWIAALLLAAAAAGWQTAQGPDAGRLVRRGEAIFLPEHSPYRQRIAAIKTR